MAETTTNQRDFNAFLIMGAGLFSTILGIVVVGEIVSAIFHAFQGGGTPAH